MWRIRIHATFKTDMERICHTCVTNAFEIYDEFVWIEFGRIIHTCEKYEVWILKFNRAILEGISGFDPSLEMIASRYLKFSTSFSLWPFILISLWKPVRLFVITFVLSGPISILNVVMVVTRRFTRTPAFSSFTAFTTMPSAKPKLVISRPPMLTLPSWSSNASHMILSSKMLKRVGESRHPCRTPTVVLNHYPVLTLNSTALWALSYRFSMARIMLALMLYFLTVAHKASCHTLSTPCWSLWRHDRNSADAAGISHRVSWDWIFVLWCSFRLWNLLALLQWSLLLVAGVLFRMTLLGWLIRLMVL